MNVEIIRSRYLYLLEKKRALHEEINVSIPILKVLAREIINSETSGDLQQIKYYLKALKDDADKCYEAIEAVNEEVLRLMKEYPELIAPNNVSVSE